MHNKNFVHENIDVSKRSSNIKNGHALRHIRHSPNTKQCYLRFNATLYPIVDYSAFGVAIESAHEITKETIDDATLIYEQENAGSLNLRLVRQQPDNNGNTITAFEILNEPISFSRLEAIKLGQGITDSQQQYAKNLATIPDTAKAMIYEIKDWFEHLSDEIAKLQESFSYTNESSIRQFEDTITNMIANYLRTSLNPKLDTFAEILKQHSEETQKLSTTFLQAKLSYLIHQSPFADRVYNKPLGYAGDFEMMNLIYRQETVGRSLFARCLQRYYIDEPAAQAVRNRADYLESVITPLIHITSEEPLDMLSVACGPAMEWQKILTNNSEWSRPVHAELLDQDTQALQYAQTEMRRLNRNAIVNLQFTYTNAAIKNVIARGVSNKSYDLIYSAGLFDYLSDSVARKAAESLHKGLKPGGKLIIGNFNINNPTTLLMDYALDWQLIYRSEEDLIKLFTGIGTDIEVQKEPLGINLFCVIQK